MIYEFICDNEKCGHTETYMVPMAKREEVANNPCPKCGSKTHPAPWKGGIIVKGGRPAPTRMTNSFAHKGEEVKFGFANQGGRDGLAKDSIGKRYPGARVDEKSGRIVVDVVSNHPDPLGKLAESRKETLQKSVKQKYKIRKK